MSAQHDLELRAAHLGGLMEAAGLILATAESCTGGGIAQAVTAIAGSSAWFDRGFVTYSNASKIEMLGVSPQLIDQYGAVSEGVVRAMTQAPWPPLRRIGPLLSAGLRGPGAGAPKSPSERSGWPGSNEGFYLRSSALIFRGIELRFVSRR